MPPPPKSRQPASTPGPTLPLPSPTSITPTQLSMRLLGLMPPPTFPSACRHLPARPQGAFDRSRLAAGHDVRGPPAHLHGRCQRGQTLQALLLHLALPALPPGGLCSLGVLCSPSGSARFPSSHHTLTRLLPVPPVPPAHHPRLSLICAPTPTHPPTLHPPTPWQTYEGLAQAFAPEQVQGVQEEVQLREQDFGNFQVRVGEGLGSRVSNVEEGWE